MSEREASEAAAEAALAAVMGSALAVASAIGFFCPSKEATRLGRVKVCPRGDRVGGTVSHPLRNVPLPHIRP